MVINGYTHPIVTNDTKLERSIINEQKKRDHKNHHRSKAILLNVISYSQYENITNRDSTKSIFDYFIMSYEGNEQVKETKTLESRSRNPSQWNRMKLLMICYHDFKIL